MTAAIKSAEYRALELDSSNRLMEHDSRMLLGRDEEATRQALEAARMRSRMGELSLESEAYVEAAEDWLSAAACYRLGAAPGEARACWDRVMELVAADRIPKERRDLWLALSEEREQQIEIRNPKSEIRNKSEVRIGND